MKAFNTVILFGRRNISILVGEDNLHYKELNVQQLVNALNHYKSENRTIVAVSSEDLESLEPILIENDINVIELKTPTRGALISLAMCLEEIEENVPLIIAAGDAISKINTEEFIAAMESSGYDAGVVAMKSDNPNYSYIRKFGESVIEVAEKKMISNLATTGLYYFRDRALLVKSIEWVISNELAINNNYYLSTAINYLISTNAKIGLVEIPGTDYIR
jgi:NDP-sugar pyrophosphorylase family protein